MAKAQNNAVEQLLKTYCERRDKLARVYGEVAGSRKVINEVKAKIEALKEANPVSKEKVKELNDLLKVLEILNNQHQEILKNKKMGKFIHSPSTIKEIEM